MLSISPKHHHAFRSFDMADMTKSTKMAASPPSSVSLIDTFVDSHYDQAHYGALAARAQEICKHRLNLIGIQALVSFRSKDKKSLREKLRRLNMKRQSVGLPPFQSNEEIERSVSDLAGIRVAMYVPSQKEQVIQEVGKCFSVVQWRAKRGRENETRDALVEDPALEVSQLENNPAFAGYIADTAIVQLSPTQVNGLSGWRVDQIVEIQVVSVLLHAWAEVEHDSAYQRIKSRASQEEQLILDSLNGMIRSSEILLDQLYTAYTNRINKARKPFADKFKLAIFLDEYIGGILSDAKKNDLELKMLFSLLEVVDKATENDLRPIVEGLGFKKDYKLTDINELGHSYTTLATAERPFRLASHMCIPFYIMEYTLSQLKPAEEISARVIAGGSETLDADSETSYRCSVLLSSFLWLGQLSQGGSSAGVLEDIQAADGNERNALEWPFSAPSRFNILVNGEKASEEDLKDINTLWDWFEKQKKDSYFSFAFRISQLGVFGSFPDDLARLRKGYTGEYPFSSSYQS